MTPIEDMLGGVFRAKADEIGPGTVPPLRLPARRSRSLAHGGGERTGTAAWRGQGGWRGWLAAAGCAVLVAAVAGGSGALSHALPLQAAPNPGSAAAATAGDASAALRREAATRNQAAAWVAAQVSRTAIVSCDQLMCADLEAHGFPARNIRVLGPTSPSPLSSTLVIETADVRAIFGTSLDYQFAPMILTRFGTGSMQIAIRVIARGGAAAYEQALSQDLATSKQDAAALLSTNDIEVSAQARSQLASGQVDSRLLLTIAALAGKYRVDIVDFGNVATGASAGIPLRYADLAESAKPHSMSSAAYEAAIIGVIRSAGQGVPSTSEIVTPGGVHVLRIEFAAPSPLGLLRSTSSRSR